MLPTVTAYIAALSAPEQTLHRLRGAQPLPASDGMPRCTAGNSAVLFPVRYRGRHCMLKCYTRPRAGLGERYACVARHGVLPGARWLEKELFVPDAAGGGILCDVLLSERIEGPTLETAIRRCILGRDAAGLRRLAEEFDRLAAALLAAPWAHGDLKPENIVVSPAGMRLVDWDAAYFEELAPDGTSEAGTPGWQHPARDARTYDSRLDDYPAALLCVTLHALALDADLYRRAGLHEARLLDPEAILGGECPLLAEIETLLARNGEAAPLALARMLRSPTHRIEGVERPFAFLADPPECRQPLALAPEGGRWGFADPTGRFVLPPLWDEGFDFSDGVAAVRLRDCWHYIARNGRVVRNCADAEAIKPARAGRLRIRREGCWAEEPLPPSPHTSRC